MEGSSDDCPAGGEATDPIAEGSVLKAGDKVRAASVSPQGNTASDCQSLPECEYNRQDLTSKTGGTQASLVTKCQRNTGESRCWMYWCLGRLDQSQGFKESDHTVSQVLRISISGLSPRIPQIPSGLSTQNRRRTVDGDR